MWHAFVRVVLTAFALVGYVVSSPVASKENSNSKKNAKRAQEIKDAFEFAWSGYVEYAFPQDELRPVSNTASNSRYVDSPYIIIYTSEINVSVEMAGVLQRSMLCQPRL